MEGYRKEEIWVMDVGMFYVKCDVMLYCILKRKERVENIICRKSIRI